VGVALASATWILSGAALGGLVGAQEIPRAVTTDLMDRALNQELELPSAASSASVSYPAMAVWFLGIAVSVGALVGLRRKGRSGPAEDHPERSAATRREALDPKETLDLPPHVVDMLQRVALRRAEAQEASADAGAAGSAGAPPPSGGLDFVVPGYDPWTGE